MGTFTSGTVCKLYLRVYICSIDFSLVWHGSQEKYQNFDKLSGRFVSEFGMQAFPSQETVLSFLPMGEMDPDKYSQSMTVDFHNKAVGHERRLASYMVENLKFRFEPLSYYIHCTQVMQAECLATAYRLWRREWKGPGKEHCAGALVWQLNDCWPGISWSIADYTLQPKLAYYAIKRELAPVTVGMKRVVTKRAVDAEPAHNSATLATIQIWGSNFTKIAKEVTVVLKGFDIASGGIVFSTTLFESFVLRPNRSTEILEYEVPAETRNADETLYRLVLVASLIESGVQIARSVNWPEPLKYVQLLCGLSLMVSYYEDQGTLKLWCDQAVKGVGLSCPGKEVVFEDNCVDLIPMEPLYMKVRGFKQGYEKHLRLSYLGMHR